MNEQLTHILLVEDEDSHAGLVRRAFEQHRDRFKLTIAGSVAEARACLAEANPALIIADLHLPDGLGTILLPSEGEELTVPLVVMTAQGDQEAAVVAMKAGALDYLVKSEEVLADTPHIAERVLREWRSIKERKDAERARHESEERFRLLFENAKDGIVIFDLDGTINDVNLETELMSGYSREELIGNQSIIHLTPNSAQLVEERMRDWLSGEKIPPVIELEGVRKDGSIAFFEGRTQFIRDQEGNPTGYQGIFRDISERRQSEAAMRRLAEENSVLSDIGRIVNSSLEINGLYEQLSVQAARLIQFDRMVITLVDNDLEVITNSYVTGIDLPERRPGERFEMSGSLIELATKSKRSHLASPRNEEETTRDFPLLVAPFIGGLRSFMVSPLISGDRAIGAIQFQSIQPHAYTEEDIRLSEAVCSQIAGAIANAQLYAERTRLADENLVMAKIARIISSSLEITDVFNALGEEIRNLIPFDRMTLIRFEQEGETVAQTWALGTEVSLRPAEIPQAGSFAESVIQGRAAIMLEADNEPDLCKRFPALVLNFRAGMRSFMAAPLIYRDKVIGVLQISSKELGVYSQSHLSRIERVANEISGAVANSQLYTGLKRAEEADSVMAEIGRTVSASLDINEVYESLGEEIRKLIPFDRFSMTLVDHEKETTSPTWKLGAKFPGLDPGDAIPLAGGLAGEVVRTKSPILLEAETAADLEHRFPGLLGNFHAGFRSFLAVPLFSRDAVIGVLRVGCKNRGVYTQRHLKLLEQIGNQIAGAVANYQLYAESVQAAEAAKESEVLYRTLVDNSVLGMGIYPPGETMMFSNQRLSQIIGYSKEEYESPDFKFLDLFLAEDQEMIADKMRRRIAGEHILPYEVRLITKVKTIKWVEIHNFFARYRGRGAMQIQLLDVTERKQAEDSIRASLDEKEVLLKEINHRVKNNLQIISSLLDLQSRDIKDEQALRSFQVSQDRIRAMALVHEKFYQSDDLARIDFGEYIRSLIADLGDSYGLGQRQIELKIDAEEILLGVDTAIPCGLIVNELVSNSLKHAFQGREQGEISIKLRTTGSQHTLVINDNGIGFPVDLDISRSNSLGLTIVKALASQLGGQVTMYSSGGAKTEINFPANQAQRGLERGRDG